MARAACLVPQLLVLLLLLMCCSISARSLAQAAEKAEDGMLPYLMLPPLARKESPDPNQIDQTPHDKLTTAASADIAQVPIPALYLRILDRHNVFRARHGVANLTWDAGLAATARTWARGCKFAHNPASGVNFGENIHAAGLGSNADLPAAAMQATFNWYNERLKYKFSNPGFSFDTGHFTAVVWKATTKLGCFAAACPNLIPTWPLGGLVVCNYSPAGNFGTAEDYRANILPVRRRRAGVSAAAAAASTTEHGEASTP